MLWISKKSLLALLSESFDKGVTGSADLSDDYFQDLIIKVKGNGMKFSQIKLSELQKIGVGRRIFHPLMGEGVFIGGDKLAVCFSEGNKELNSENADFWACPIALLGTKY